MAFKAPYLHCRLCGKRYRSDKITDHDLNCGKYEDESSSYTNLSEPELVERKLSTATLPNINSGLNQIRDRPGSYDNVYDPTLEIRRSSSNMKPILMGSRESIQEIVSATVNHANTKVLQQETVLEGKPFVDKLYRKDSIVMFEDNKGSGNGLEELMNCQLTITNRQMSLEDIPLRLSGSTNFEDSFPCHVDDSYYENHRKSLVPCCYCERKFVPDRLKVHEKSCIERPKTREYMTPEKKV